MKEATEWHRVSFFGRLAEVVNEYLKKGSSIYIEGRIRTRKYTDQAGVEKYSTEIVADQMQMLGGRSTADRSERDDGDFESQGTARSSPRAPASRSAAARPTASAPPTGGGGGGGFSDDDDIPFAAFHARRAWSAI